MEETNMSETMLENRIVKLESEIKELKTELSIALEFYAEVKEFLSELMQLTKKSSELSYSKPTSILESTSSIQTSKPKSKLDSMLDHCINLIFQDYREQTKEA
jgi:hypothetical protein